MHQAIDRADLIISIGHDTVEKPPFIMGPKGPKVLHISYLPATVDEVYFPHAEVVGDVGPSLTLLADRLEGKLKNAGALLWLRSGILARLTERADESRFPLTPQRIVHDVRHVMPADGIVCLDNGMYKIWFARNYRTQVANTLLLDNALATMGAGLPAGIMAALLYPQRRVLAVCGDGGFMMNAQELETAVRLRLDLVVLVLQDDAYGMIRWKQATDGFADFGMTFGNPDFVAFARAHHAGGARVETAEGLVPALERAFQEGGVQLVAVPIDYSENTRVLVDELRKHCLIDRIERHADSGNAIPTRFADSIAAPPASRLRRRSPVSKGQSGRMSVSRPPFPPCLLIDTKAIFCAEACRRRRSLPSFLCEPPGCRVDPGSALLCRHPSYPDEKPLLASWFYEGPGFSLSCQVLSARGLH